jgi:hypothetical protein
MLFLFGLFAIVALVIALARSPLGASTSRRATTALRLGGLIGVVRLSVVCTAVALASRHDWRSIPAYGLLIVSVPVELMIATRTGIQSLAGVALLVGGLMVGTSLAWDGHGRGYVSDGC